jgi:type I restriction enzyme S subunit
MNKQTAQLLEQHFDTAFAAPDGVARLRGLILNLAMQGKLVAQNPNDPPASELLKEIEKEKVSREGAKTRRGKEKKLPPIKAEEVPYELPQGWEWVRLGEIGIVNPRNDAEDSAMAGFVPMPMIPDGYSEKHQFEERPWSEIKKGYTHFADGDVGMAKITPCFENAKSCVFSGLPNGIGAGTTELHIFRNSFNSVVPRFLLYYLKNPHYISKAVPSMTGSAGQKRVPTPYFTEQLFPLPSLPEQHRIVARIDQLMARCDALEKLRKEREEKRLAVHAAAIKQLLDPSLRAFVSSCEERSSTLRAFAPSREENSSFAFLSQHFGALYTVKENVAELRKTILQLAVMGRLVPQDPKDTPASQLLKEIEAEKQRLVKASIFRNNDDKLSNGSVCPFELPQGWKWASVQQLGFVLGGKRLPKGHAYSESPTKYRYLTVTNMKNATIIDNDVKYISHETHKEIKKYVISRDDIYITIAGTIGAVGIIPEHCDGMNLTENASRLVFLGCDKLFLVHLLSSGIVQDQFAVLTNKMAQPKLSLRSILSTGVPVPPLAEQHRIVARIDQLMALCDTLDQQIDAATGKQTEILNAVMGAV